VRGPGGRHQWAGSGRIAGQLMKLTTPSTNCRNATSIIHSDPERTVRVRNPEDLTMEVAAFVLIGSVVAWFVEELSADHE
jgi:hypothetical protein